MFDALLVSSRRRQRCRCCLCALRTSLLADDGATFAIPAGLFCRFARVAFRSLDLRIFSRRFITIGGFLGPLLVSLPPPPLFFWVCVRIFMSIFTLFREAKMEPNRALHKLEKNYKRKKTKIGRYSNCMVVLSVCVVSSVGKRFRLPVCFFPFLSRLLLF